MGTRRKISLYVGLLIVREAEREGRLERFASTLQRHRFLIEGGKST
jgi:hypothetical protein